MTEFPSWNSDEAIAKVMRNSQDYALLFMDASGSIQFANHGALAVLEYGENELVGLSFKTIFVPEDVAQNAHHAELRKAATSGRAEDERWHFTKTGKRFWATGVVKPIINESGELVGYSKLFRDKTSRKKTEDEIKRANAGLLQFSSTVAHDLQAPLRSMVLSLQLAVKKCPADSDNELKEAVEKSLTIGRHMQQLIKDLLAYSETGLGAKNFKAINCNAVFDMSVSYLQPLIEESGAAVTRAALPDLVGNPTQIELIFQNLITNAIKYRSAQPPVVHFKSMRDSTGLWLFSAEDNGMGIAAENLERIFDSFERVATDHDRPGTGLGLAICKRIVEGHGGRIWAEQRKEGGTVFYFTLP